MKILFSVFLKLFFSFLSIACFTACTSSADQPKQSKQSITSKKALKTPVSNENAFNKKIKKFKKQLKKINAVRQDSLPVSSLKNCGYNFFEAFTLIHEKTTNKLQFQFYSFKENTICDTAQQKLLSNVGDNVKIEKGKNLKHIKSTPWYIIKNKSNIVTMNFTCENDLSKAIINKLKEQLRQQFATPKSEVVNIRCGGPVEWL